MKILQLSTHFSPNIGGVETHLDDLVKELISKKHQVFVLTYRPLVAKTAWKIREKRKYLEILRLPWLPGFFYKFVENPILEFFYLVPGLFLAAPYIIFAFKPDVIHSHGLIAGFVAVFWGKMFGVRVITTTHSIYHFPKMGLYKRFAKIIFENSDSVLALSRQSAEEINSLGISNDKIKVFMYWIDLNKFNRQSKFSVKIKKLGYDKKFTVLFVGRLVKEKGILILFDAAKKWNKNIMLLIIGSGPLEESIKHQVSSIKNISYIGKIDNKKLPEYYNFADLTVVPSIHEEGFGRVILESLACGTPVIAANRGAIPEAMDETVGYLINITADNIRKVLEKLYKSPRKMKNLAKNARNYAVKKYSQRNIERILSVYKT